MKKITDLLEDLFDRESIVKMVFSGLRKKSLPYQKAVIRPILLNNGLQYQIEYHYEKKVTHENMDRFRCMEQIESLLNNDFKQLNIFSSQADYQVLASKPDHPKIIKKSPTQKLKSLEHNKKKQYIIPDGEPCDFLIRLGVMDQNGQVFQKHYAKFRQINRFLEIVSDILSYLPEKQALKDRRPEPLRIIDFGCGKAYLTFALYHYLKLDLKKEVSIIGLDLKEDVIEFCNRIAGDLHYENLTFQMGDIADYSGADGADMVVTLHACDTATDYALIKAVNWNASVILSVPCCQHELFHQISNDLHHPILKHGILKERYAAILTDGLRALKLEEQGYHVDMIEFTSLEHTSKNIMIRAVKTDKKRKAAGQEFDQLKQYWNVNPTIGNFE
jgi:hypothetical protein